MSGCGSEHALGARPSILNRWALQRCSDLCGSYGSDALLRDVILARFSARGAIAYHAMVRCLSGTLGEVGAGEHVSARLRTYTALPLAFGSWVPIAWLSCIV